ncbi:MAG: glycerophosphodiester phosphodiesterase [Clostridiales bacterium]|nr:glycerophosphodiester phosphodiesterase [Clostridiales bacterium]
MKAKIYAHRGASGYAPENTLEAFELAVEQGAEGVELDVHLTRDRQIIVTHDERIDRVSTGIGLVSMLTVKEIKKHLFNKPHPQYMEAKAPLLEEVLELLKPTGLHINIELKNSILPYKGMEAACLEMVAKYGMEKRVLYSSFNHHSMLKLKQMDKTAACGLLYDCCLLKPADYLRAAGMDALHPNFSDVLMNPEGYTEAMQQNGAVNVWTVNDERDMRLVMEAGVDLFITNYPDRAVALRESMSFT